MMKKTCGNHESDASPDSDTVRILRKAELFSPFSAEELAFFVQRAGRVSLSAGQPLFAEGEPAESLYVVVSGSIEIVARDQSIMAQFVSGDSFGELEFLTKGARNATARALEDSMVLAFPAKGREMEESLAERPAMAARILHSFLTVIAGRIRKANSLVKENSPLVRELKRQVYGDKLTGLLNRAYLEENLARNLGSSLALVMLKPDNFKDVNDRFGHEAGDAVLVRMANDLASFALGRGGTAVRYEGNEIALFYPGMDREAAEGEAEAIRSRISDLDISPITGDESLRLSASLGVACYPDHGHDAAFLIGATAGLPLEGRRLGGSRILWPEDIA